ncbi:tumor necrosis factor receptor superfamily member 17 [Rhinatrema bivittatum]|uniref:tumor necrosis factor receptor superfamily member 17 n=1 Tax=Rhinatrema bivittatum TaxID=194408 RepID=UPI0011281CDE|nr:tumor necrosis factor receptor superfamily member 17 [Rhinatrema bivittatum]
MLKKYQSESKYQISYTPKDNKCHPAKCCFVRAAEKVPSLISKDAVSPAKVISKDTDGVLWICLGAVLLLTLTVFILTVLLRKLHPKVSKDELWQTENGPDPKVCKLDTENSGNKDVAIQLPPGTECVGQAAVMCEAGMEESAHEVCSSPKLQPSPDAQFPLPATEEGATVLVTTKTSDFCSYRPGVLGDTFVEIWKSFCSTS